MSDEEDRRKRRELSALIERVEKATGPDREIDAAIEVLGFDNASIPMPEDRCALGTYWRRVSVGQILCTASEYTSSLDAVVALVERDLPEADWRVERVRKRKVYYACLDQGGKHWFYHDCERPTPALALLLAFLRAKASQ